MERADGKAAGDDGFITCQRIGLADGARADAIRVLPVTCTLPRNAHPFYTKNRKL
jgi:hypothetical protein